MDIESIIVIKAGAKYICEISSSQEILGEEDCIV